jgi:shikimate kinase
MKNINILIGSKGSGKTHIGELLERKNKIPFLRVENICLKIKRNRSVTDKEYIIEVFQSIEKEIRLQLNDKDQLTIETTASALEFDTMLSNLKKDFMVKLVKIDTDALLCLQRVKCRESKNHIPVSDEIVQEINQISAQKQYNFDLIISNNNKTDNEILEAWNSIYPNKIS